jgi:hypothetical protein
VNVPLPPSAYELAVLAWKSTSLCVGTDVLYANWFHCARVPGVHVATYVNVWAAGGGGCWP